MTDERSALDPITELQREVCAANVALAEHGLAISTFGNVSAFDPRQGVVAIKPSGVPYRTLRPSDVVVLDVEGNVVRGQLRPSSDTPTHLELYRSYPSLGGICHTHSTYATAWAQAGRSIPLVGTTHADYLPHDVPCCPPLSTEALHGNYERATALAIVASLGPGPQPAVPMSLVPGHGPFTWGSDSAQAVHHAAVLEQIAMLAYLTLAIAPGTPRLEPALIARHYQRKNGASAYYGQAAGATA